jgi:ABC-2 type transport system permease protein
MDKIKCVARWGLLLWKRLYKKASFVLLLLLIPLLALGYGTASQDDSGIMTVALASEATPVEPLTQSVWDELQQSNVVRYVICQSPEQARDMVKNYRADVAWIFAENIEEKIYTFAADRSRKNAFVTIVEPKDRTILKLGREILSGVMFSYCSEAVYLQYIRENVPELAELSDQQLLEYFHNVELEEGLFAYSDVQGNVIKDTDDRHHYLLTPVRGIMAVIMVLAALATAMYYLRDVKQGTFSLVPHRYLWVVELGCQLITSLNVAAVVLLSLIFAGQISEAGREVAVLLVYSLCVGCFAMLVRRIFGGIRGLAMVTPLLVLAMLAVCPVFLNVAELRGLQMLFLPTYYINGIRSWEYLVAMALYGVVCLTLCLAGDAILEKGRMHKMFKKFIKNSKND